MKELKELLKESIEEESLWLESVKASKATYPSKEAQKRAARFQNNLEKHVAKLRNFLEEMEDTPVKV